MVGAGAKPCHNGRLMIGSRSACSTATSSAGTYARRRADGHAQQPPAAGAPSRATGHAEDRLRGRGAVRGGVMAWWDGEGAACVLEHEGDALLMERAMGESLAGGDGAGRPRRRGQPHHLRRGGEPACAGEAPCPSWCRYPALVRGAGAGRRAAWGRDLAAAAMARELLAAPREAACCMATCTTATCWMSASAAGSPSIPSLSASAASTSPTSSAIPIRPRPRPAGWRGRRTRGRGRRPRSRRLLRWILAYAGLSATWTLDDGDPADLDLAVADIAAAEVARG